MYKFLGQNSQRKKEYRQKNCDIACETCKMCQKDTRDFDGCWSACDACNNCHAMIKRADIYNTPYEYAHPMVSRSFDEMAYPKQFCENICHIRTCKAFNERMYNFNQCKRCQQQGKCWSPYQSRCIDCPRSQALTRCEDKYGCTNPLGYQYPTVPPINPMYTDCVPCWNQLKYTT